MDSESPWDWVFGCKLTTATVWAFLINTKNCLLRTKKLGHERLLQTKYDLLSPLQGPGTLGTLLFPSQKRQRPLKINPAVWSFQIFTFAHKDYLNQIWGMLLGRTSNLTTTDFQRQKVGCQKVHTALLFKVCLEFSNTIVSKGLRVYFVL